MQRTEVITDRHEREYAHAIKESKALIDAKLLEALIRPEMVEGFTGQPAVSQSLKAILPEFLESYIDYIVHKVMIYQTEPYSRETDLGASLMPTIRHFGLQDEPPAMLELLSVLHYYCCKYTQQCASRYNYTTGNINQLMASRLEPAESALDLLPG